MVINATHDNENVIDMRLSLQYFVIRFAALLMYVSYTLRGSQTLCLVPLTIYNERHVTLKQNLLSQSLRNCC